MISEFIWSRKYKLYNRDAMMIYNSTAFYLVLSSALPQAQKDALAAAAREITAKSDIPETRFQTLGCKGNIWMQLVEGDVPKDSPDFDFYLEILEDEPYFLGLRKKIKEKPENKIQLFRFESSDVRIMEIDNVIWWIVKDVCNVLGLSNPSEAIRALDDDEKMTLRNPESHSGKRGGAQTFTVVNESGLYALILRSNKPQAKKFRKWVTSELLPTLRRIGRYEMAASNPLHKAETAHSIQERNIAVREKHAEARRLEALARSTRELRTLAKEHAAALPQGFVEKVAAMIEEPQP